MLKSTGARLIPAFLGYLIAEWQGRLELPLSAASNREGRQLYAPDSCYSQFNPRWINLPSWENQVTNPWMRLRTS
jgi:hypothetical protein